MNFRRICFFVTLVLFQYTVFSQVSALPKNKFWKNARYGGNINLGFSDSSTNLGIAPSAIYQFNDQFAAGISIGFGYSNFRVNDLEQFNYSGSSIFLYNPVETVQLSAEFEQTFVTSSFRVAGRKITDNFNFPALYLGIGYRVGFASVGVRYDVLFDEDRSIFSSAYSPFVRIYF